MNPKKNMDNYQALLNDMASQGWEFKQKDGVLWIFEREKQ